MTSPQQASATISPQFAWGLMIVLSLIWGSSYILIKKSLTLFHPGEVGALRILISAICFSPLLFMRLKKVDWKKWPFITIVALTGSGVPAFLYPMAQVHLQSAVAGILNALTPLFTLILGVIVFRKAFHANYLIGIGLGLLGVILLFMNDIDASQSGMFMAYILAILAALCYGTSVNTVERFLKSIDAVTLSSSSFVLLGPVALGYLLYEKTPEKILATSDLSPLLAVTVLSVFGTFLSTMIFFYMVQRTTALFGSLVAYLIPIVAVGWGYVFKENLSIYDIAGLMTILLAIYLSRSVRKME